MARIRKRDLVKIFFRSLYIQAAWNYERMLSLGFCYCLVPVAKRLFKKREKQAAFLKRHLEFFNSHPYLSTFALGAVANIEQQAILKRWDDLRPIEVFKNRVIGPLGVIGDMLFWQLLLPFFAVFGVISLFLIHQWGIFVFLVLYNICHFYVQIQGLIKSFIKGFDIIRDLSLRGTRKYFQIMNYIFNIFLAIAVIFAIAKINQIYHTFIGVIIFFVSVLFSYLMLRKKTITIELVIIIVVLGSVLVGLIIVA